MSDRQPLQLVVQTAFLGDLLLSVGLLKALRERHPERRLGLMCREKLGEFLLKTGVVDELFEIRKGDRESYRRVRESLRNRNLVAVYSPHSSVRTALFVWSLRAPESVSFRRSWNSWVFQRRVPRPDALPDVLRQMSLLAPEDANLEENLKQYAASARAYKRDDEGRLSGVPLWASISLRSRLLADRSGWTRLMEKLDWQRWADRPKVLIFPGSVWATKRWTESGFVAVGSRLVADGAQVLVMGAGNEQEIATRVAAQIPGAVSLAGRTDLYDSALLLAHSDLMVGNDSASIHLAAIAETPTITVFGPTVPEMGFRPWSDQATVVEMNGLACRPCGPHGHNRCPRGTHECMKNLAPENVIDRARSVLGIES